MIDSKYVTSVLKSLPLLCKQNFKAEKELLQIQNHSGSNSTTLTDQFMLNDKKLTFKSALQNMSKKYIYIYIFQL